MNSKYLEKEGFGKWINLDEDCLDEIPKEPGVYAMKIAVYKEKLMGKTDIIYIGKAESKKGLRGRIRKYLHPGKLKTAGRINENLKKLESTKVVIQISWKKEEHAKDYEEKLLKEFEEEHLELPPFNHCR